MSSYKRDPDTGELEKFAGSSEKAPQFVGATGLVNGQSGIVPQPLAGDQNKVLYGDGSWRTPHGTEMAGEIDARVNSLENAVPFGFDIENGSYGYKDSNDVFHPFKSQADIDAAVTAAMIGNATAADVVDGKTFTNSTNSGVTGSLTRYPAEATGTFECPANWNGGSPTAGGNGDMGATNNYRYVNAENVYTKGQNDKLASIRNVTWEKYLTVTNILGTIENYIPATGITKITWIANNEPDPEEHYPIYVYQYSEDGATPFDSSLVLNADHIDKVGWTFVDILPGTKYISLSGDYYGDSGPVIGHKITFTVKLTYSMDKLLTDISYS